MCTRQHEWGTKVYRYYWHSGGSLGWPFPMLRYKYICIFSNKIYRSNFIKQHSETVMVWNYENADCSFKKLIYCVVYYNFRHTFVPCAAGEAESGETDATIKRAGEPTFRLGRRRGAKEQPPTTMMDQLSSTSSRLHGRRGAGTDRRSTTLRLGPHPAHDSFPINYDEEATVRLVNVSASRPLSAFKISEIIDIVKTRHVICSTLRTAYRLCKSGDSEGLVLRFRVRIRVTVRVGDAL